MATTFETDTAVEQIGDGRWRGVVNDRYAIPGGSPNGGYVMAMAARAMAGAAQRPHPVSITAHFAGPADHGPADIDVTIVRPGGRHATVQATLTQDGRPRLALVGTFADLDRAEGATRVVGSPPDLPPREECAGWMEAGADDPRVPEIARRLDARIHPDHFGWTGGEPSGSGRIDAHVRLREDEEVDAFGLIFLMDCLAPPAFDLGLPFGWVPTVELTVQLRRPRTTGWSKAAFSTRYVTDGYLEEDGELWSPDGDLLAISRQLALAPRPFG